MKTLWYGGTIYTMRAPEETVEAILTEAGRILKIGSKKTLIKYADKLINLGGSVMYPGFVDSHVHMLFQGEKLTRLDLSTAQSKQEMLQMIRAVADVTPTDQWLLAEGWNENNFEDGEIPTRLELDEIRKEPILLKRICHHVVLCNTSALAAGGITEDSPDLQEIGGEIGRDEQGTLTGLLFEQASNLVLDALPKSGAEYVHALTEKLNLTVDEMIRVGLTGAHTEDMHYFGSFVNPLTAFHKVIGEKRNFRVNILRHHVVFEEMIQKEAPFIPGFIEPGAMKIFADGALGGRTAALKAPYEDDPHNSGMFIHTDESLMNWVKIARKHQEAVAIHMIGDAAAEQVIRALKRYPAPHGKRDRLIHASLLNEAIIKELQHMPVVIDAQPAFVVSDFPWIEERLGCERSALAYPWKTLLEAHIRCAAGTDAPVESFDPLQTIYAAVARKSTGDSHDGYGSHEKISRFDAIRMYTVGSAEAIGKENERGYIAPDYVADFTIYDRDLFAGTTEDMLSAQVTKTVVAENIVYENSQLTKQPNG